MKCVKSLLLVSALASCTAYAENELNQVINSSGKINQSALATQKKIDVISDSMLTRLQKFKALNKEIDGLTIYNAQLNKQLDNQQQELETIADSMTQVSVIERQITPLMLRMIAGLTQFISLDVPFLTQERQSRLAKLNVMMDRADITSSEKFRRVLEAYQIEVDYGRTIEAYTSLLTVNGKEREVDFLRIGRLDLIYMTRDGKKAGIWDKQKGSFIDLPDRNLSQISKGLRIARKQLAPDMITLPVQASE